MLVPRNNSICVLILKLTEKKQHTAKGEWHSGRKATMTNRRIKSLVTMNDDDCDAADNVDENVVGCNKNPKISPKNVFQYEAHIHPPSILRLPPQQRCISWRMAKI